MPICDERCKVGKSPHLEEYDRARLKEHKSYLELADMAKLKGEEISHMTFWRHYSKHVSPLKYYPDSVEEDKYIQRKHKERINLLEEIESNLKLLKRKAEEAKDLPVNASNLSAFARLANEFRQTLKYIAEHRVAYMGEGKADEEDSIRRFINALDEIPEEYRDKVIHRLTSD